MQRQQVMQVYDDHSQWCSDSKDQLTGSLAHSTGKMEATSRHAQPPPLKAHSRWQMITHHTVA
eukprot:2115840-Amphidinium_carterae.2